MDVLMYQLSDVLLYILLKLYVGNLFLHTSNIFYIDTMQFTERERVCARVFVCVDSILFPTMSERCKCPTTSSSAVEVGGLRCPIPTLNYRATLSHQACSDAWNGLLCRLQVDWLGSEQKS